MTELIEAVYKKYHDKNMLNSVMFELTHRCICRCIHCYIDKREDEELATYEVIDLLHQCAREGVFNLGLTGGEVFLREDLAIILGEAKACGFFTFILTTGILVDESAADLLMQSNLHHVEISLMGATAATHDLIMRHAGAFNKTIKAVRLLRERGIPVVLKSSILKQNVDELESMAPLAASLDSLFNASLSVLPGISGNQEQQGYALDYAAAKKLKPELMNGGFLVTEDMSRGAILECNAGKTNCGISPSGELYPCLIWRRSVGDLRKHSLHELWHSNPDQYLERIRTSAPEHCVDCASCNFAKKCHRCPGMAFSEAGDFQESVGSACLLAGRGSGLNQLV